MNNQQQASSSPQVSASVVTFGIVPPSLLSTLRFSSTTPTTSQFTWALTEDQRIQFEAEFEQNDTDKDGFLSGDQSRDIFLKTGVPVEDLFNIWKLADRDGDSRLSEVEYIIARFLIFARQQGQSIPTKLPDSLIQSLVETDPQSRKKSKKLQKLQNSPSFLKKITRTGSKDLSSEKTKPSKDKEKEKDKEKDKKEKKKTPRTEESGDKKKTVKEKKNKEKTDSKKEAGENPKVPPSSATTKDKSSAASSHALEKSTPSSSSSSMTSKTKKPDSKWVIPHSHKRKYRELFKQYNQNGIITGPVAVQLFTQSGLSVDILAKIWDLADMDKDGGLTQQEFLIAAHLISKIREGVPLPQVVPSALVASAASSSSKSSTNLSKGATLPGAVATPLVANTKDNISSSVTSSNSESDNATKQKTSVPFSGSGAVPPGVNELTPVNPYKADADIQKLDQEFSTVELARKYTRMFEEETSALNVFITKLKGAEEAMNDKLKFRQEQIKVLKSQKSDFESALAILTQETSADEEELRELQKQLQETLKEIETQQGLVNSTRDIQSLSAKKQQLSEQFEAVKNQYKTEKEEYERLVEEVKNLKDMIIASAEQKHHIDTQIKDSQFHTKISPAEFQQFEAKFEQTFDFSSATFNDNKNVDLAFDFTPFTNNIDSFGADTFGGGATEFDDDSASQQENETFDDWLAQAAAIHKTAMTSSQSPINPSSSSSSTATTIPSPSPSPSTSTIPSVTTTTTTTISAAAAPSPNASAVSSNNNSVSNTSNQPAPSSPSTTTTTVNSQNLPPPPPPLVTPQTTAVPITTTDIPIGVTTDAPVTSSDTNVLKKANLDTILPQGKNPFGVPKGDPNSKKAREAMRLKEKEAAKKEEEKKKEEKIIKKEQMKKQAELEKLRKKAEKEGKKLEKEKKKTKKGDSGGGSKDEKT